jgi:hypothetical protein
MPRLKLTRPVSAMNSERLTTFDRRGARAMGSQPAPQLVLACCGRLQKSQEQKAKNIYTGFFRKPGQARNERDPGLWTRNDFLFFPSGLARLERAKPEGKKRLGVVALYPGRRPQRPCPGLLSCCPTRAPERRTNRGSRLRVTVRLFFHCRWPGASALCVSLLRVMPIIGYSERIIGKVSARLEIGCSATIIESGSETK